MSDIPSLRPSRKQWFRSKTCPISEVATSTPAPTTRKRGSSLSGLWTVGLGVLVLAVGGLIMTSMMPVAAPAPAESVPEPPKPKRTVQVPRLEPAPVDPQEPESIARVHSAPTEEHKGCYVVVGVALPLSGYRMVARERGAYMTARVPLRCTTGEDLQLEILLDCPASGRCETTGFFSRATRSYYRMSPGDLELQYKNGSSQESYPTHLLVLRPTRLKTFSSSWGIE